MDWPPISFMKLHTPTKNSASVLQGQEMEILSSYISSYIGTLKVSETQLSNINTRYISGGSGTPLIFLHGLGATKAYFRSLMKSFAPTYHVIAPDVPGLYPQVRLSNGRHQFRGISQWFKEFTNALNLDRYILVGNSLAANIAAYHAHQYPDQVERLCLMSFPETFDDNGVNTRTLVDKAFENLHSIEDIEEILEFCFYNPPNLPNVVKRKMLKDAISYQPFVNQMLKDIRESHTQLLPKLGRIACPTLLLSGDEDPICPAPFAEKLERIMPNAELHILAKSKHMTFLERHHLVEKLLSEFLREPLTKSMSA